MRYPRRSLVIAAATFPLAPLLTLWSWSQESLPLMGIQPGNCLNVVEDHSTNATQYREIRTIKDPATHHYWILVQNLNRPAAPALQLLGPQNLSCAGLPKQKLRSQSAPDARNFLPLVIHAGDYLIVSEHTSVLDADLEAIALQSAAIGNSLTVRLKAGGRTLNVIATGPSRAAFLERGEVRR